MSSRRILPILLAVWLLALWLVSPAVVADPPDKTKRAAEAKESKTKFVRLRRMKKTPVSLDTAIVTYVGRDAEGKEVRVDLIGVVHIADKAYYQKLNKEFEKYEAVLYELVAPKGAKPKRGQRGMYEPIARMLKLSDQIRYVDYEKKNFVHADMTGKELLESMRKRDESFVKLFFQAVGQSIVQQTDPDAKTPSDGEILAAMLFSKDPAVTWKRLFASQFENMEASMAWLEGPNGSTLITERNKVALKVLQKQLDDGKRKVAVFYGAGHLPDMERRLIEHFGLKRAGQRWLVAWQMEDEGKKK